MTSAGNPKQVADEILSQLPHELQSQPLGNFLRRATPNALWEAGKILLAAGQLEFAKRLFTAMKADPAAGFLPFEGLARVAAKSGEPTAIIVARADCLNRFPERAEVSWYLEIARAERRLGDNAAANLAAAAKWLQAGLERFPDSAPLIVEQATLFVAMGKTDEAVERLCTALQKYPEDAKPNWYLVLARAHRDAGRMEEERKVVAALAARFPGDRNGLAYRAHFAAVTKDWSGAHALWLECIAQDPEKVRPDWLSSCANALYRLGRLDEAWAMWSDAQSRFPEFVPAFEDAATARQDLGHWTEAEGLWNALIGLHGDRAKPEWHVASAICCLTQPQCRYEEIIAQFESRYCGTLRSCRLVLVMAEKRRIGFEDMSVLVDVACRKFPHDRPFMAQRAKILLAAGRISESEAIVTALESSANDATALLARWTVMIDRGGIDAIKQDVQRAIATRVFKDWPLGAGITACHFLRDLRCKWALEAALTLSESLEARFPGDWMAVINRAWALVETRRDEDALRCIEQLPDYYRTQAALELKAWAAAKREALEEAKNLWRIIVSENYFPAVQGPEPGLQLVHEGQTAKSADGAIVVVPVRDEMPNISSFLEHHRALGIRQFVVVDNMSKDGTAAYLAAQPDVILYRTSDSFPKAGAGMRWINALMEQHGRGRWCLFADADEHFVFPGCEYISLDKFTEYLDSTGVEAVKGYMLDVYPERLRDRNGQVSTHADCKYYDRSDEWLGHVKPPWWKPLGGVRARLFGAQEYLLKVPLMKGGAGCYLSNHETTPVRFADVTSILLHYKCIDLFWKAGWRVAPDKAEMDLVDRRADNMRRYERYASRLPAIAESNLHLPGITTALTNSMTLAGRGVMHASPEFCDWLASTADAAGDAPDMTGAGSPHSGVAQIPLPRERAETP